MARVAPPSLPAAARMCRTMHEEDAMLFAVEKLESEICKLRGLLRMLHEDQPDVLEDVFEFHVGSLISHASPESHDHIRACAHEMLAAIQALPRHADKATPDFSLMPEIVARPS
nr:hypothetical protein [Stenotrophomonas sp. NA06056]